MLHYTEALNFIVKELDMYKNYISPNMDSLMQLLMESLQQESEEEKEHVCNYLLEQCNKEYYYVYIYILSVVVKIKEDKKYLLMLEQFILETEDLTAENLYYLFHQIGKIQFMSSEYAAHETEIYQWRILHKCVNLYKEKLRLTLEPIPMKDRNENLAFVFTEQFLSANHGPTKTALDRCKTLISSMGKQVVLINTAELQTEVGAIPFYKTSRANYIKELSQVEKVEWDGIYVPYVQCDNHMPDIDVVEMLLNNIKEAKPKYIINIGGSSLVANLANELIPVLTIGCVPSELSVTTVKYQTTSKNLVPEDLEMLSVVNKGADNVIKSVFTSAFKPQKEQVERRDLGIPENAFVIALVGGRLNNEISKEFLDMLQSVMNPNLYVITMGPNVDTSIMLKDHPALMENWKDLGFCDDVLARMECCNLYVNPKRKGGGTSGVEAMYKGVPVVTIQYGDVAVNSGEDFCVADYKEMADTIRRYQEDREFYKQQSEKARKRAEVLMDTDKEFIHTIQEMDRRENVLQIQ